MDEYLALLKQQVEEWKALEPENRSVGDDPNFARQMHYIPSLSITTDLFKTYLQILGIDTCNACQQKALFVPEEIDGHCLRYEMPVNTTLVPSEFENMRNTEMGTPSDLLRPRADHYALDCQFCGNRMLFRKTFVHEQIDRILSTESENNG